MYATGNKKMLNMLILEILEVYSDCEHHLTQQKIIQLLEANYGMPCDRRSVKSNIMSLKELGYEIGVEKGYWLIERKFEDAELRMLIDSVLFSKTISRAQAKRLIDKLESFGNRYFNVKVSHVSNLPELQHSDNKQVMCSLDVINDAIDKQKKVQFVYNSYGTDFNLHPRREERYVVNPYQMVANNGRYYLICNYDKYDVISHYRIDKMTSVEMLEENIKDNREIKDFANGFNLPRHVNEHVYMFSGKSVNVRLRTDKNMMDALVDWFGKDFNIIEQDERDMIISLHTNEQAMVYWAMQYGTRVEVLAPTSLREQLRNNVNKMYGTYNNK